MTVFRYCPLCGCPLTDARADVVHKQCNACRQTWYRNPTVGVAVILLRGESVLLVQRRCGRWCIPCGHVDWNEDIEDAARRELLEETGLECDIVRLHSVHSNFHDQDRQTVGVWYLGKTRSGELLAGDDAVAAEFLPLSDLPPLAFPTDQLVVEKLRSDLAGKNQGLS